MMSGFLPLSLIKMVFAIIASRSNLYRRNMAQGNPKEKKNYYEFLIKSNIVEKVKNMTVRLVSVVEPIRLTCFTLQKNMGFDHWLFIMIILGIHRLPLKTFVRFYQPWM